TIQVLIVTTTTIQVLIVTSTTIQVLILTTTTIQQKLQKSVEEDIAGNYFKPKKRANELLVKFQEDTNMMGKSSSTKKNSTSNTVLNMSLGQSMWGNTLNLSSSFNNSQGSSLYNSS
ncbi:hypothetical protein OTU49_015871, partial [Cherax quadricarinatus]